MPGCAVLGGPRLGGSPAPAPGAPVLLQVSDVTLRFGGVTALGGVSFDVRRGELFAVIGPNGAGKSTLINLLSGDLKPTAGSIRLRGEEVAGCKPDQISRLGVGRSYQKTNIFPRFTAYENCRLAAQSRVGSSLRFFRAAETYARPRQAAERALDLAGLTSRSGDVAQTLSHGEQRQLEIAMTLATNPLLLLLDEPLAGMGAEEGNAMVALLKRLRAEHAIILVEHDMDAVFALADRITVMGDGALLASGAPAEVRASPAVQKAYLGVEDAESSHAG